ncbi:hypothetical protein CJ030_MR4G023633 [Morella rubra]|uniref:Uncharacterized protein n=1 Tax=Morella rubra TaxID=262757 RepID=A0A6A1VVL9_9ROSI|nr:hypothetical protein CJ030_MR7G017446 [Morella rubra]KAB1215967.1 hypothetical protein CJ030_MR4G023633 [Morella rubra]
MEVPAKAQTTGQPSLSATLGMRQTNPVDFPLLRGVSDAVISEAGSSVLFFSSPALKDLLGIGQAKKAVPARLVSRRSLKKSVLPKVSVSPSREVLRPTLGLFEKLDCAFHVDEAVCGPISSPFDDKGKKPMVDAGETYLNPLQGSFHRLVDGPLASAQPIPTLSLGFPVAPFSCPSK